MKRSEYNHELLEGPDADIETSLKEYGLAWIDDEKNDDILFYYGIGVGDGEFDPGYTVFDFCSFPRNLDIKEEFDWADFEAVGQFVGDYLEKMSLQEAIYALLNYYGPENVFGSSYYEGLEYSEIVKE